MLRSSSFTLKGGIIALSLAVAPSALRAEGLGGSFQGQVTQNDPPSSYDVHMELYGRNGSIYYPSFPCSGTLEFVQTDGTTYWYRERITQGQDVCVDDGMVSIRRHALGGATSWEWRWVKDSQEARGVLHGAGTPHPR